MSISVLIAIVFFVGAAIIIQYLAYLSRDEAQKSSWQQLATAHDLELVSGTFFDQEMTVFGNYREHYLTLETVQRERVIRDQIDTYTRLTICTDLAVDSNDEQGLLNAPAQLNSVQSPYPLKGHIETTTNGQTIIYEQKEIEKDVEYLQSLFDMLSDVADVYPKVVALGAESMPSLHTIITDKSHMLSLVAAQMLRDIGMETTNRLEDQAGILFCPQCLVSVAAHKEDGITYYDCRVCGQSRKFIESRIVAVLDQEMPLEQMRQDGILRTNWLIRRDLFDFDEVEIIQATDEEVERFAVQVGNDTDIVRRPRYKQMRCSISSSCNLTENTKRILKPMFGHVVEIEQPYSSVRNT